MGSSPSRWSDQARGSFMTEGPGVAPLPPTPEDSPGPAIRHERTLKTLPADKIAKESGQSQAPDREGSACLQGTHHI